jgi:hypothetical protein
LQIEAARGGAEEIQRFGIEAIEEMRPRIESVGDGLDEIEARIYKAEGELTAPW